jgi:hypothetical protein
MIQYDCFMPRGKPFARIAITLPVDDLEAADRLALEQDRSRSWIVAEAVRRYVREQSEAARAGLGDSRREQLRRDLTLSPVERVRAGEEGLRVVETLSKSPARDPLIFDSFDAFLSWSRTRPSSS